MAAATLNQNRNSILLPSIPFPVNPSPAPSTSSSASSTSSHTSIRTPNRSGSLGPPSHRRIRFAPLPDPRRDDDDNNVLVTDIDIDVPSKRHSYPFIDDESCSSSAPSDTDSLPPSLCTTPIPTKPTTQQLLSHTPIPAPSWSRPKSLSLLRPFPFKKSSPASSASSSHSLTPTPSLDKDSNTPTPTNSRTSPNWSRINFSTEEILTLGTINLFRPSSKNNGSTTAASDTPPSSWGLGLTRWSSAGSTTKVGSPLGRTQSTQSYTSGSTFGLKPPPKSAKKPRSNSATAAPPSPKKSTSMPARKGTRMLNGRVYGGPKRNPDANPFANARDDDPEFVEWGYGGMGSVRGAHHAGVAGADAAQDKERTRWERLHSDGRGMVVGSFAEGEKQGVGGVEGVMGDDGDDGSGMGWVKKRREAREREKKEKEEKERAEAEAAKVPVPVVPAVEEPIAPVELTSTPEPVPEPPAMARLPSTTPSAAPSDPEHILKTVTLPAHLHHHHSHRRTQSRTTSAEGGLNGLAGEITPAPPSGLKETIIVAEESPSESESESETEAEDDSPIARVAQDEEEEDDEEDEEEAEQDEARKTALGAGVEKISRHN
ncbi:hypothetical protein BDZ94DRAFT_1233873 [Collybia nuda]|uniref:Uncharacterized protein n=1 Tax=Collybia nuda TaxID=64659 RepID=A0A9P5Y9T9_9AGAR|nr:hypothetical protein BDZ94DRAFT_1233873 [Collybia nuda]